MKGWQLVALVLLADGCVGGGCNPEEIPENDVCTEPGPAPDSVEIGVYLGQDEGYLALADSDVMEAVTGGQGTDMLRLMLRMEGSRLGCVEQVTTVSQLTGEPNQWSVARPLQVYEDESDGIFYTNPTFVILDFPPPEDG
ncbi:MAG: hypothetical protein KJO07_14930, partial [Deltaproteobacteria bacterium]|nr:hypothetical protein [Deltaproteobacteria bacterium]